MNPDHDFSDYPRSCIIYGVTLYFTGENQWLRRFESKDGMRFHVNTRTGDGSFDYSILDQIEVESLTGRERFDAGRALINVKDRVLPDKWQKLVDEHREKYSKDEGAGPTG